MVDAFLNGTLFHEAGLKHFTVRHLSSSVPHGLKRMRPAFQVAADTLWGNQRSGHTNSHRGMPGHEHGSWARKSIFRKPKRIIRIYGHAVALTRQSPT